MEHIAIVGTGVAGVGCAWNLRHHAKLTLFEKAARPGGHTNTVVVKEDGHDIPIDTGFIVFNKVTYPNLCQLFDEMGVEIQPSEMSFSVQHLPDGLEYNGMSLPKIFAQKRNLLRPRFYHLLGEINRFFKVANASLSSNDASGRTVRQYAEAHGFGQDLLHYYLVPMSSAVWSTHPDDILDFPAEMLIRFFYNHGFLGVKTHHPWFTVSRGSQSYLRKILAGTVEPRLGADVVAVEETGSAATIRTADGRVEQFDRVIVATHADEAINLLACPDSEQARLLKPWQYQANTATLHTDASCMPTKKIAWASWNYRLENAPDGRIRATTHYWMNALQQVSKKRDYFVSINADGLVDPASVLYKTDYTHPGFTLDSIGTQSELPSLNRRSSKQRIYFCGSYFRHGFHEDAYWSAVELIKTIREHLAAA